MSHFGCESFEYKVDNAAREASAGAGHAFAAGGRRVMDSEIGLSQGTLRGGGSDRGRGRAAQLRRRALGATELPGSECAANTPLREP